MKDLELYSWRIHGLYYGTCPLCATSSADETLPGAYGKSPEVSPKPPESEAPHSESRILWKAPEAKPPIYHTASGTVINAPVAYRVKDFADGWILCPTLQAAEREAVAGNLIEPLFRATSKSSDAPHSETTVKARCCDNGYFNDAHDCQKHPAEPTRIEQLESIVRDFATFGCMVNKAGACAWCRQILLSGEVEEHKPDCLFRRSRELQERKA
jgi:hypothetical protein